MAYDNYDLKNSTTFDYNFINEIKKEIEGKVSNQNGGKLIKIAVVGVGGAGSNAIENILQTEMARSIDCIICNTDAQNINFSSCPKKIQIGPKTTEGLGAGGVPEIGENAAIESKKEIEDAISGYHMIFIASGMGGGTGTGASPVIAKIAKDKGILTVSIVTKPFEFEGKKRMKIAESGIEKLSQYVDSMVIVPNQNLFRTSSAEMTMKDAFQLADKILQDGVEAIVNLIGKLGLINIDYADIRSIMKDSGLAMINRSDESGSERAVKVVQNILSNPLLDADIREAKNVLLSISGGSDMTLHEVGLIVSLIQESTNEDVNIIFGSIFDEALEGSIELVIIATGLKSSIKNISSKEINTDMKDANNVNISNNQKQYISPRTLENKDKVISKIEKKDDHSHIKDIENDYNSRQNIDYSFSHNEREDFNIDDDLEKTGENDSWDENDFEGEFGLNLLEHKNTKESEEGEKKEGLKNDEANTRYNTFFSGIKNTFSSIKENIGTKEENNISNRKRSVIDSFEGLNGLKIKN
jgi:cell division protein FtsZ